MRNEETGPICSSEQLESVRQLVGPDEPALFTVLQQLTKEYDEKTTLHLAKEFCFMCHSYESKRVGMEFLYMNGFDEDLQKLIEINCSSNDETSQEWGYVYQHVLNRRLYKLDYQKNILEFLNEYKTEDLNLQALKLFLRIYSHCDIQDFKKIEDYHDELTASLLHIDNTLLRIYFQMRENELMFHYHWKRNELEIARTYAFNILDNTLSNYEKKCYTLLCLSQTYIFEGYDKSKEYADRALRISKEHNLTYMRQAIEKQVIPFISASNGIYKGVETTEPSEVAHLAIAAGNLDKAIEILSNFEYLTPFQEYYLGLAKNDKNLLYNSYKRLKEEYQDVFFANLPLKELKKRGWDKNEEEVNYVN
ncbi:hypothetical protein N780_17185 [Pontibacillus chungwhensis BH030062]|uniref:Uncharacterized protein n=1 Tax=Pontibacillus chungwhensis BH030062 TaxID=1385513 RepID=A0A0A2US47_9BACI|nr:AimR family lysis-lysogeny pheromone receptor [Pontibacillus chungwhensis]KGP91132.1 hypothetical protein N780_17185 [Pontibacillus chungwhensis BH030062]